MSKDYYKILGVEKSASKDKIKLAFHKLAKKYHPDKRDGGDEQRFKEVNEAYQTLSNERKRAEYDSYGHAFPGGNAGGNPFGGFSQQGFNAEGFDLGDIFGDIFGGGRRRAHVRRGRDISVDIELSFADAIFGVERKILLVKNSLCSECSGTGGDKAEGFVTCESCNGQGQIHETRNSILGPITSVRECGYCKGDGKIPKKKCKQCSGLGIIKEQKEIAITIPAGIQNGEMIRLRGAGEAIARGTAGDLYIKVHVESHKIWRREGHNLVMDLDIKLTDALLGSEYTIDTIDGPSLNLKIPAGTSIGEILRIRDRGVPLGNKKRGDMLVKLHIKLPKRLSHTAKKLFADLQDEGV